MSKRLQVVFDDAEYRELKRVAKQKRMSVSEWVRQALRRVRRSEPVYSADRKLEAVRVSIQHEFPTADIGDMLAEVERGFLEDPPE